MKVVVAQENLLSGLNKVARTVAANATLPVLANVLLTTADDSSLGLASNNLDAGTFCTVDAEVLAPGSISVPAKLLTGLAASFPKEKITLELDAYTQTLTITCLDFVARVQGIDAGDFPTVSRINAATGRTALVDPEAMKEAIDHVLFCLPTDQSRPILTGAELVFEGRKLTLRGTDGFRLTEQTLTLADALDDGPAPVKAVVPGPVLADLSRLLNGRETLLLIALTGNTILFNLDEVDIAGRLIEGRYPEVGGIIPTEYSTLTRVRSGELLRAVKVSHWFAKESANICRMVLAPDRIEAAGAADGTGSNTAVVQATGEGPELQLAFNSKYLMDVLATLPQEAEVLIETTTASRPAAFRVVGCDSFLHVLMPMHVDCQEKAEKPAAEPAPAEEAPADPVPAAEPDELDKILAEAEVPPAPAEETPAAKRSRKARKSAEAVEAPAAEVAA